MRKKQSRELLDLNLRNQRAVPRKAINQPILAIDYGEKYCGLAYTLDGATIIPLSVVRLEELWRNLEKIFDEKKIDLVVFGLPLGINNEENHICEQIRIVAKKVIQKFKVKTTFVNERYSSQNTFSIHKSNRLDDLAAMNILQYYLDKKV